jgi:hypothetical protein
VRDNQVAHVRETTMATKHEDHPKDEKERAKDRPMPMQGDRTPEEQQLLEREASKGVRIDDVRKAQVDRPHSYLDEPMDERTGLRGKPESPSDNPGQKTRDNVTPVIPSAPPREGGIVDPNSLGMPQGGVQPAYPPPVKSINEPRTPAEQSDHDPLGAAVLQGDPKPNTTLTPGELPPGHFNASINEPLGSDVGGEGSATEEGGEGEGEGGGEGETDEAPDLERLEPDEADAGDAEDIVMHVHGTGFTEESVIYFNGLEEPTTFVSETEVTTGVKPSLFVVPAVCPVTVRNGSYESDALEFEFLDPEEPVAARETKRTSRTTKAKAKPKKAAKKSKGRK